MTQPQITTLIQALLQIVGTTLVSKGIFTAADWTTVAGALLMMSQVAWSMYERTKGGLVASANALPEVAGVITKPTAAGDALAAGLPTTVAPAGSQTAQVIAKTGEVA